MFDTHQALDQRLGVENGFPADATGTQTVAYTMLDQGRGGRHYGGGFYDYAADGSKTLWPGLDQFRQGNRDVSVDEAVERMLYRQAIETLRCYDEGVLRTEVEANLGGIFAIGFPRHTGGALQYIRGIGIDQFAARAAAFAETYGARFHVDPKAYDRLRKPESKAA